MKTYGMTNGHHVGRILKETVRRAILTIRAERQVFEAQEKLGLDGTMNDVFTSADTKAQEIYLKMINECFEGFGVVAEENKLTIPCTLPGRNAYITIDPLDGTKAFIRRQSHGVSTMIALIENGVVDSAYIGDINTEEMYGYRPDSNSVHRITDYSDAEVLTPPVKRRISESYGLLRDPVDRYSQSVAYLVHNFKSYEVEGGSIGTWYARLWKKEVAVLALPPGKETPWDVSPLIGISKKLGYKFLKPIDRERWTFFEPELSPNIIERDFDMIVVHESEVGQLLGSAVIRT